MGVWTPLVADHSSVKKWGIIGFAAAMALTGILILIRVLRPSEPDTSKLIKHGFAILAASLAVVGSFLQAEKARSKSQADPTDSDHFAAVGTLWYVVFVGALTSLASEGIDIFLD
jgi:hypothetical protein